MEVGKVTGEMNSMMEDEEWIEMDGCEPNGGLDNKQSRFQVAKVDNTSDHHSTSNSLMSNNKINQLYGCKNDIGCNLANNSSSSVGGGCGGEISSDVGDMLEDELILSPNQDTNHSQPSHHSHSTYDTRYLKSLRHMTREALPRIDHYRNILSVTGSAYRPTLDDLHNATITGEGKVSY